MADADAFLSRDTETALLKALDDHLSGRPFICGEEMTTDDVKVFAAISGEQSSESYPNTIIWYRKEHGWVRMGGQVEQSNKAEDDVEETEEGEKAAKRKRAEDDVGEETEEEAAKASERMWSLEVDDADEQMINLLEKNVPKLDNYLADVASAKLVHVSEHEGRKTVRIEVIIINPFENRDEEYLTCFDDFIHSVLFCDSD